MPQRAFHSDMAKPSRNSEWILLCSVHEELFPAIYNLTGSGDEGIRTPDPLLARQVLSQLSYTPMIWQPPTLPYRLQYSTIGR